MRIHRRRKPSVHSCWDQPCLSLCTRAWRQFTDPYVSVGAAHAWDTVGPQGWMNKCHALSLHPQWGLDSRPGGRQLCPAGTRYWDTTFSLPWTFQLQPGFTVIFPSWGFLSVPPSRFTPYLWSSILECLLLGRKVMSNLDSIFKSRDITSPTKVHPVKAMVFPVVMYGCESRTVKKAECRRIDAFELWCWRRLLRVPWTARRSNQSILKEISPGISLEVMMLKLKSSTLATSCEELTHWKRLWCWEGLGAGGEGDDRGWDGWIDLWLNGRESEWTLGVGDGQEGLVCCDSWGHKEWDTTERLNWTHLNCYDDRAT